MEWKPGSFLLLIRWEQSLAVVWLDVVYLFHPLFLTNQSVISFKGNEFFCLNKRTWETDLEKTMERSFCNSVSVHFAVEIDKNLLVMSAVK